MSTSNGDNAARHELEIIVRTELILAETSQSEVEVDGIPAVEWPSDPEAQRYEIYLRTLLGAVEAVDGGSGRGDHPPQAGTARAADPFGDGRD
jgi:hypothetical protein